MQEKPEPTLFSLSPQLERLMIHNWIANMPLRQRKHEWGLWVKDNQIHLMIYGKEVSQVGNQLDFRTADYLNKLIQYIHARLQ